MSNWRGKSIWSVSSRFTAAGLAFLVNVLLTRGLSKEDVGHFFLSLSIAWGGALVCQWGSSILAVKWIATARARGDLEEVRESVWSLIFFTLLQGAFVALIVLALDQPIETRLIWLSWTFAVALQNLVPEIMRGFDDVKWASLLSGPIPQAFCATVVGIGELVQGRLTFQQASLLFIFSNLLCTAFGLSLVAARAPIRFRLKRYTLFLRETTPIALSLAATYFLSQADLWVCGYLLPKEDVATYGIAQRFVAFVSMPMMIYGSVVTPKMAELLSLRDWQGLNRLLHRGTFLTSLFATVVFLGGVALGWPVMKLLFGETYTNAYPLFLFLGAGQVIHALAGPNGYILLLSGQQSAAMIATVAAAIFLAAAALIFGRSWGTVGIAFASALALTLQTVWMWVESRRRLKVHPHFRINRSGT